MLLKVPRLRRLLRLRLKVRIWGLKALSKKLLIFGVRHLD